MSSVVVPELMQRNAYVLCGCEDFPEDLCGFVASFFEPAIVFIENLNNLDIVLLEQPFEDG